MKCVICGETNDEFGHNPEPIAEGTCCTECNSTKVIPARMKQLTEFYSTQKYMTPKLHSAYSRRNEVKS